MCKKSKSGSLQLDQKGQDCTRKSRTKNPLWTDDRAIVEVLVAFTVELKSVLEDGKFLM